MAKDTRVIQIFYWPELRPVPDSNRNQLITRWKANDPKVGSAPFAQGFSTEPIYLFAPRPPQPVRPEWQTFTGRVEEAVYDQHPVYGRRFPVVGDDPALKEERSKRVEFVWSPPGGTIEPGNLERSVREEFFLFQDKEIAQGVLAHMIDPAEPKWAGWPQPSDTNELEILEVNPGPEDLLLFVHCRLGGQERVATFQGYTTKQKGERGEYVWTIGPATGAEALAPTPAAGKHLGGLRQVEPGQLLMDQVEPPTDVRALRDQPR